ncbi:hypothetical protein I4U23_022739 [Adineta vaga]|nr:hypothetical protein I4U23_022739 [Adineta vaga]
MAVLVDQYPKAMLNCGLFKEYSVDAFNNTRFINDSCAINVDAVVPELVPMLKKYRLDDLLGLSRTHQHFRLKPNEVAETSIITASACSIPVPIDDPQRLVMHLKTINLTEFEGGYKPVPYMWAFDKESGKFFALQYFNGSNRQMIARLAALGERTKQLSEFLIEFIHALKQHHMEEDLGIFLRYQDLISWDEAKEMLMEDTSVQKRTQIMYPMLAASGVLQEKQVHPVDRVITTQWIVGETIDGVMQCRSVMNCHNH